ncbi:MULTISPECIES: hypothetical protein [Moorena]|uniref:Uncharacterized protein n=1 Tax=Moorena bouillonii PNG TaxID=568701 RepID=A0A1U7MZJ8_9CYAN|nr:MULTISPECIES: hypothetical protein [Moorena]NEO10872.1 hypothetical protein [Moorena sp. SIO3E8]NEP97437.1 hypothetical protein [Moorena sp. SIO3F7]OLT59138.1 hypothetical protein BJP37_08905 [Moorena bouillonii PNG]
MNYPIPASPQEIVALRQQPVDEELVVMAIAGVIQIARQEGQSLDDLTAEVLAEDDWLDHSQRVLLNDLLVEAWESLPELEWQAS